MSNIGYELNEKIHAIIINPYLSWEELNTNCNLIKKYNIRNVSTSLNFLGDLKNIFNTHKININALISFPFADLPFDFIDEFLSFAIDSGAGGIEYTPNFFNLSKNNSDAFAKEIERVNSTKLPVSIVINNSKLDEKLFEKAIEICLELGIENFQLGDGFGPNISSKCITKFIKVIDKRNFIKVVGGIKKLSQVIDLFDLGIDCIGTSNFHEIFKEIRTF